MAKYFAISDPHGCLDVLKQALSVVDYSDPDNRLFLLGDYIAHSFASVGIDAFLQEAAVALRFVKDYCEAHEHQVIALMGNHEDDLLRSIREDGWQLDGDLVAWLEDLLLYYETDKQIFVHAGLDEEAGDLWRFGTDDLTFSYKFPATFGPFYKDIVAGHVGTHHMFGEWGQHDVFWDGQSHYYLDGTTEGSGVIPVLIYDTETEKYMSRLATAKGVELENPVLPSKLALRSDPRSWKDERWL